MSEVEFRLEKLLDVLARHSVRHVLIGGFAGVIHGSPYVTTDIDIVPEPAAVNLTRLSAALDDCTRWCGPMRSRRVCGSITTRRPSRLEDLDLVTGNEVLQSYPIRTIW